VAVWLDCENLSRRIPKVRSAGGLGSPWPDRQLVTVGHPCAKLSEKLASQIFAQLAGDSSI
jgi:hypothetical protein